MEQWIGPAIIVLVVHALLRWAMGSFAIPAKGTRGRKVLRISKVQRALGWAGILLGVALGGALATTPRNENRDDGLVLALVFVGMGMLLLYSCATRWEITRKRITQVGLFRRKVLDWKDVETVTFSTLGKSFVLRGRNRVKVEVPLMLDDGGADLVAALQLRVGRGVADAALRDYEVFRERFGAP